MVFLSDDAEVLEVVLQDGVLHGVEDLPDLTSGGEAVRLLGIRKSKRSRKGRTKLGEN